MKPRQSKLVPILDLFCVSFLLSLLRSAGATLNNNQKINYDNQCAFPENIDTSQHKSSTYGMSYQFPHSEKSPDEAVVRANKKKDVMARGKTCFIGENEYRLKQIAKNKENISLARISVNQGNGNGKSIEFGSEIILYTENLVDCIAILILSNQNCIMIHSDANSANGKGHITLEQGFKNLGLSKQIPYKIGLIGGNSKEALEHKSSVIKKLLPKADICFLKPDVNSAYFSGSGLMAESKDALKIALAADKISFIDVKPARRQKP